MAPPRNRPRAPAGENAARGEVAAQRTISASFEGPIPPPNLLAQYNDIIPDGAERILAMAESNSRHRQELENFAVRADHWRSMFGIAAGLIVAITFAVAGLWATLDGHEKFGLAIIGLDMVSLVGTFVYGTESRKRERRRRIELMTGRRP